MFNQAEQWTAFRASVLLALGSALLSLAGGWLMYGPLFRITTVTVTGTRVIDPKSVLRSAERYLKGQRFLIIPKRTIWTLSSSDLTKKLEQNIRQRISVERVVVQKHPPHEIQIVVTERTPVVSWLSGNVFATVDQQGRVIDLRSVALESTALVRDENATVLRVDESVVKPEVIRAITQLDHLLHQANIAFDSLILPVPTCAASVVPDASSTLPATNASNTNSSKPSQPVNDTTSKPVVPPVCDRETLRYSSQEIHVQLKEGARVLFDRQSNLSQSVQALKRVLAERADITYTSIDVRFGDRVYVK